MWDEQSPILKIHSKEIAPDIPKLDHLWPLIRLIKSIQKDARKERISIYFLHIFPFNLIYLLMQQPRGKQPIKLSKLLLNSPLASDIINLWKLGDKRYNIYIYSRIQSRILLVRVSGNLWERLGKERATTKAGSENGAESRVVGKGGEKRSVWMEAPSGGATPKSRHVQHGARKSGGGGRGGIPTSSRRNRTQPAAPPYL